MTCKRSKQCDHADLCRFAQSDDYNLLGGSCFTLKDPQTNEEWLRSCPPQELIRFLMNVAYSGQIRNVQKRTFDEEAEKWCEWLKEIHND